MDAECTSKTLGNMNQSTWTHPQEDLYFHSISAYVTHDAIQPRKIIQSEESWVDSSNDMDSLSELSSSKILKLYTFDSSIQKVSCAFQNYGVQ
jgi:hypothetical protein